MRKTVRLLLARLRQMPSCWGDYWSLALRARKPFLLERAHLGGPWWMQCLAVVGACTVVGVALPGWALPLVAVVAVPGVLLDATAICAHLLWAAGRIWQDIACPCCDGPGGGWWGEGDPQDGGDDPEDHGLTRDDLTLLHLISSGAVPTGPTHQETL